MKPELLISIIAGVLLLAQSSFSQDAKTLTSNNQPISFNGKGLLDPSRFSIQRSISFGMASNSGMSDFKSQSLYTTMLTYKVSNPVTLNFNFSLPIFSSYNSTMNPTQSNLKSLEYFSSVPFDASMIWRPQENMSIILNISRNTYNPYASPLFEESLFHSK